MQTIVEEEIDIGTHLESGFDGGSFIEMDIQNLCRLCGQTKSILCSIFENNENNLREKIDIYLPIKINENDILPIKICENCTNQILNWHKFYGYCIETNLRLQELLLPLPSDDIEGIAMATTSTVGVTVYDEKQLGSDNLKLDYDYDEQQQQQQQPQHQQEQQQQQSQIGNTYEIIEFLDEEYVEQQEEGEDQMIPNIRNDDININENVLPNYISSEQIDLKHEVEPAEAINVNDGSAIQRCQNFCCYGTNICNQNVVNASPRTYNEGKILHNNDNEFENKLNIKNDEIKMKHDNDVANNRTKTIENNNKIIINEKYYLCPICNGKFSRKYNLNIHISDHVVDHYCKLCCLSFVSSSGLYKHVSEYHNIKNLNNNNNVEIDANNIMKIKCHTCEFKCNSTLILYHHYENEHDINKRKFQCTKCNKLFITASILATHMRRHLHSKDYVCNLCDKILSNEKSLYDHIRLHTGDRPYKCNLCDKAYKFRTNLHQHNFTHTNIRKYSCTFCSLSFYRSTTLREHERIHRKEKPHICLHCKRSFIQRSVLQKHLFAMHRKCDKCGSIVGNKNMLILHNFRNCKDTIYNN